MAVCPSLSFDREERSAHKFARVRQIRRALSKIDNYHRRRRTAQELARELKIGGRVSFTGFISQEKLREIFYASHIFLHPSETGRDGNQEGVPNSMLEAMASGLPVFATQHGGIPEAIEHGVSGVLVPERDHEALARALLNVAQDPALLSRMARAGGEAVRRNFDLSTQTQRLEEIYLQMIARLN